MHCGYANKNSQLSRSSFRKFLLVQGLGLPPGGRAEAGFKGYRPEPDPTGKSLDSFMTGTPTKTSFGLKSTK